MPDHSNAVATSDEPVLIFQGGVDELQLEPGGKVYYPGDAMPKNMSQLRRVRLQADGVRFETRHPEPVITPDGKPAEMAAAEQIDPPTGVPAVVAAVEDMPKIDAPKTEDEQPAPRASRRS